MKTGEKQKILEIIIDEKIIKSWFKSHVENFYKKILQNILTLGRLSRYLSNDVQKSLIFKSVIRPQFSYCPVVWFFCSRQTNKMIDKRALRIALNDQTGDFKTLLAESSNIFNHHKNIQTLMTDVYKIQNKLAPLIMETMLERKTIPYNLRNLQGF